MSMWDDEAGYDLSDPKHPTFADRMYAYGDYLRKKEREDALAERTCAYEDIDESGGVKDAG